MITEIRNSLKSSGFRVVLWIALLSFIVANIMIKQPGRSIHQAIATINNQQISLIDFDRRLNQEKERINLFRQQFGFESDSILKALGFSDPQTMTMNSLIQEALLNDVAQKMKLHVGSDLVTQKLSDIHALAQELSDVVPFYIIDQNGINLTLLQRYLTQNHLSMQDFETKVEEKIKRNTVLEIIGSSAYVSGEEMKDYFIKNYLAREYTVVTFPFETALQKVKSTKLTDQDVADYFEKNNKKYWIPEKRSGSLWIFSPKEYGITVSQQDVESYYNAHKSQFIETPLQVQVRQIVFRVAHDDEKSVIDAQKKATAVKEELAKNPQNFEKIAREQSEDKKSASQGGLIDFFKKGQMDTEFERAAFRLQKDGDISDIVPTSQGFEIIQRVARKPATYRPLATVEHEIRETVYNQKFKTQFTDDVSKILSKNNKESLQKAVEEFAKNKHAKSEKIENIGNDGSPFAEKVFKTKQGEWSFLNSGNNGQLLTVSRIEKSHKPELVAVKKQVEQDVYLDKAHMLLQKDLDDMKNESIEVIKSKYPGLMVKKTGLIKSDDKEKLKQFAKEGIPVSTFKTLDSLDAQKTLIHENNGYLIKVNYMEPFNQEIFDGNKNTIANLLYDEQKQLAQRGFIASLYRNATINLTKEILTMKDEDSL